MPKKPRGLQPQSQPQGSRTPDWPAEPATKPQAPHAKLPVPSPPQARVTLEPDGLVERKLFRGDKEGTPRTAKLQKLLNLQTPR